MTHHILTERPAVSPSLCVCSWILYQLSSPFCLYLAPWTLAAPLWYAVSIRNDIASWFEGHLCLRHCKCNYCDRLPQCFFVGGSAPWSSRSNMENRWRRFDSIHTYPNSSLCPSRSHGNPKLLLITYPFAHIGLTFLIARIVASARYALAIYFSKFRVYDTRTWFS